MKKLVYLSFIFAFLILFSATASAAQKVTVYGDDAYAPYSFLNGSTPDGIYVKILQAAFAKMGDYDVTIELVPWKRAMKLVERGTAFAAFPPYYRPEQRPWIDPYSEPIIQEGLAAYCRKEVMSSPRGNWPDDYKDLEIGVNAGFSVPNAEVLKIQESANNEANIKKLQAGRIDCYVNDDASIKYSMKQMNIPAGAIVKGTQISLENGYLGFSKNNNAGYKADFLQKFNAVIKEMKSSGEIDKIMSSFLGN